MINPLKRPGKRRPAPILIKVNRSSHKLIKNDFIQIIMHSLCINQISDFTYFPCTWDTDGA